MRTPLVGLASQVLVAVTTERSTYVGVNSDGSVLETTPTVLLFSASRLSIENPFQVQSARGITVQELVGLRVVEAFSTEEELVVLLMAVAAWRSHS